MLEQIELSDGTKGYLNLEVIESMLEAANDKYNIYMIASSVNDFYSVTNQEAQRILNLIAKL